MRFDSKIILCGLVVMSTCSVASHAADLFGNPTLIGTPGMAEIQIGGGKTSKFELESSKTVGTTQIGAFSESHAVSAYSGTLEEDQVVVGLAYSLSPRTQLFANMGTGKDSGQKSSSHGIGVKISPQTEAPEVRMGLMLRAQQVKMDIDGPFDLSYPYSSVNDGTNTHYWFGTLTNGTEQIKYTRMDAFFGASTSTGIIRPYGGLCLTHISGTDTIAINDTITVSTYPNAGGPGSSSTQTVSFNAKSDISGNKYFTGVLGFSINPDSDLGMTAELQIGVQKSIMLAGSIRF